MISGYAAWQALMPHQPDAKQRLLRFFRVARQLRPRDSDRGLSLTTVVLVEIALIGSMAIAATARPVFLLVARPRAGLVRVESAPVPLAPVAVVGPLAQPSLCAPELGLGRNRGYREARRRADLLMNCWLQVAFLVKQQLPTMELAVEMIVPKDWGLR
jgi:hypothetical protein